MLNLQTHIRITKCLFTQIEDFIASVEVNSTFLGTYKN